MVESARGFTLLELLIAIAIVGTLAVVTVPRFLRRAQPAYERKQFLEQLDSLLALGWQQAILTNRVHAVDVNGTTGRITLEAESDERDRNTEKGAYLFKPVSGAYLPSEISIPATLVPHSIYIEGKKEPVARGGKKVHFWFFLVPEGLAQEVIINWFDKKDSGDDGRPAHVGLVLNPFRVRFNVYDTFQKP